MVNLNDKIALITGAGSGIGAATAKHFASLGCSVAINGRNVDKLKKTFAACVAAGLAEKDVLIVPGDVSVEEQAVDIVEKTVSHFGRLDILVNNAGIGGQSPLDQPGMESFDKIINTNLRATYHLIKLCAPHLKKTKGNIVNVSSVASTRVFPSNSAYAVSKAGLDHLTRTAALELGKDQVRVNSVNPAAVDTDIFTQSGLPPEKFAVFFESLKKLHVLDRVADPIEIAKPIAFLASQDASFITGSNLLIDGGLSVMGINPIKE